MEENSNLISTKEKLIKNFSKEQLALYNYYLNMYSKDNENSYPTVVKDKELKFLENGCNVLSKILKIEAVIVLIVVTCFFMFGEFGKGNDVKYKHKINPVEIEIKYNPNV